jgi:hypothetical protein
MKGIDNRASTINNKKVVGSPPTAHRTSLVENIQVEREIIIDDEHSHHKLNLSSFFSLTLHSLGIIFGDM